MSTLKKVILQVYKVCFRTSGDSCFFEIDITAYEMAVVLYIAISSVHEVYKTLTRWLKRERHRK